MPRSESRIRGVRTDQQSRPNKIERHKRGAAKLKALLLSMLLLVPGLRAQDRPVDPTWLHRYVPDLAEAKADLTSATCHYRPIFGEGDKEKSIAPNRNSLRRSHSGCAR